MVELSRYNVSDEQAGIDQDVLKNKLGYTNQKDLDDAETILQADAYKHFFDLAQTQQFVFGTNILFKIHKYLFETLYDWAGTVRTVDMSKGEMLFAPVQYLSNSVEELNHIIQNNIPTYSDSLTALAQKLAIIHNEFNVVHPFRDGNGRTIRYR
ncbi:MAG: Fic family protein [Candidatus Kerfeldbacteria bacterium]|nr:Fic family protein [Candidatus Kerfeldbacteria bacterium]